MNGGEAVVLKFCPPPSTNQLYSGRRFKTTQYKAWIESAGWEIKLQWPPAIKGPFALTIYLPGRCDIDNLKAIPDLLKRMGVIEDDRRSLMRRLVVEPSDDALCRVTVTPL